MRRAMATAEVGDDVYGEDPTVNRLQELAAEMLGKESALFVASGTMGNFVALLAHCGRGDDVILGDECHIFHYEQGGASALGGMPFHPVGTAPDGTLPLAALPERSAIDLIFTMRCLVSSVSKTRIIAVAVRFFRSTTCAM